MLDYALLIVDETGKVEFKNRIAAAMLRASDLGLSLNSSNLSVQPRQLQKQFKQAIRAACYEGEMAGLCLPVAGAAPSHWLRVVISPIDVGRAPRCAAVWVVNPTCTASINERLLEVLFNLSPAEARLAHGLLRGSTIEEYAQRANVGVATVRSQLHSIFSKTGVRRQAELIGLLSRIPALQLAGSGAAPARKTRSG